MKAVHFKSKSNEKFSTTNTKNQKVPRNGKNITKLCTKKFNADIIKRPDSCPVNANWGSSRNWHEILSEAANLTKHQEQNDREVKSNENEPVKGREEFCIMIKQGDELTNIVLPTVNFCYPQKENDFREDHGANIVDLCDEEKRKIAMLVQEIAKCKKEKQDDEETIAKLKNDIIEMRVSLNTVLAGKNYSENKVVSSLRSRHSNEQSALKKQVTELSTLVSELQLNKRATDARLQTVLTQAERLTLAMHALHAENERLRVELRLAEDRLAATHRATDHMISESREKQTCYERQYSLPIKMEDKVCKPPKEIIIERSSNKEYSRPLLMEDKACQPSKHTIIEQFSNKELYRPILTEDKACQPSRETIIEEKSANSKQMRSQSQDLEDQFILKELFFNKDMENDFSPKETVIFLMKEYKEQLPQCLKSAENID